MSRGVIAHGGEALFMPTWARSSIRREDFGQSAYLVDREPGDGRPGVFHDGDGLADVDAIEAAAIAYLAAGFGVERVLIENNFAFGASFNTIGGLGVDD